MRAFGDGGLLDELWVHVVPMLLGGGTRLFANGGETASLALRSARTFFDGVVELGYALREAR
jgi:dihydrofolate reductase